jgi:hypothetical protein
MVLLPFAIHGIRSAIALATALALLLPFPARCAACSTGHDRCPRCHHEAEFLQNSTPAGQAHSCCQHRATTKSPAANAAIHPGQHACGCAMDQAPRTAANEKFSPSHELSTGLVATVGVSTSPADGSARVLDAAPAVPPPIPHRILHCSWII